MLVHSDQSTKNGWSISRNKRMRRKERKEEDKYADMVDEDKDLLNLINDGQEAIITLDMYKDEFELAEQRLHQSKINIEPFQQKEPSQMFQQAVNLPQLQLPTFSGDPKLWREFWGSFDTAVHLQKIPGIKKLNYLISCLKGNALQAVKDDDIAPENYSVIRKVLVEKFRNLSTIKKSLYNELYSIKGHDREWKTTVETMERIFRQLEAMGECLEHSSIEIIIESRLPVWILGKVYQQKKDQEFWSVARFRKFLQEIVQRNGEVQRSQTSSGGCQRKSTESKSNHDRVEVEP
uniref:Retrotrans_gag domain-containing protein n=1 Tax=Loa loa TaxID=7209 RepID=A0A1I7VKE8_LOALO